MQTIRGWTRSHHISCIQRKKSTNGSKNQWIPLHHWKSSLLQFMVYKEQSVLDLFLIHFTLPLSFFFHGCSTTCQCLRSRSCVGLVCLWKRTQRYLLNFTIRAPAFMMHQVRKMVGAVTAVGLGKISGITNHTTYCVQCVWLLCSLSIDWKERTFKLRWTEFVVLFSSSIARDYWK
jgi:hypothetical protein